MEKEIVTKLHKSFEDYMHTDENGVEFWYARELMQMLEYSKLGNFAKVINKAKQSCKNSNISVPERFADIGKTLKCPIMLKK